MLGIENLRAGFGGKTVLDIKEWRVNQGEHWAVLGPSGCGKTTLLNIVAGLLAPSSGRVIVAGEDITAMPQPAKDRFRGANIGVMFQRFHLVEAMTVSENLLLAQYMAGVKQDRARVAETLADLNISDKAGSRPSRLSSGQAQRAAVARAVVNRPKVILADEPTSSLDDGHCQSTVGLLESVAREFNATLVIVTHDGRIKPRFTNRLELE
ncbi:MAG: ATP-binding cassette domain-containing protein [Nitrospinae bacterium]|nr:ATP-binding cassette domain-containing protein [Nitrospinota bacterium]